MINVELELGQDMLSSKYGCKEFNGKPQHHNSNNKPQFGKEEEQANGSSIFTSTPFRDNGPFGNQQQQQTCNDFERQTLNFIETMMESADDSHKLKITQEDFRHAEATGYCPQTNLINPMTLFAYSGDLKTDSFAHAFSTGAQPPVQQTFANQSLMKQGDQEKKLPERLEKSAQSNSSNGSSLTKEIFNSVLPLSFEEQLRHEGQEQAIKLREERSCSNSTLESSELNTQMQLCNFNMLY
jgi:hypothetical protein